MFAITNDFKDMVRKSLSAGTPVDGLHPIPAMSGHYSSLEEKKPSDNLKMLCHLEVDGRIAYVYIKI